MSSLVDFVLQPTQQLKSPGEVYFMFEWEVLSKSYPLSKVVLFGEILFLILS